jgi:glycosyltransferase involved in cell wall biosynthesis
MQVKSEITILLLNYKRPHNLHRIIDSLKSQTVPVNIFLWDNSGSSTFHDHRIDLIFRTSENKGCSPRWLTALYAKTKYIMTHDDDFLIINPDTIEKIVQCLNEQKNKQTIVGYEGVFVDINKTYREHVQYENRYMFKENKFGNVAPRYSHLKSSARVHLVKGRLMATQTENIAKYIDFPVLLNEREDDITVSAMIGGGAGIHLIPHFLRGCIQEIEDSASAKLGNKDNPDHDDSRNIAFKYYFGEYVNNRQQFTPLSQNSIDLSLINNVDLNIENKKLNTRFIIVSPFHNADYLEKCLKSVLEQNYTNYILVAIDDREENDYSDETKRIFELDNFILIQNTNRQFALKSRLIAIDQVALFHGGIDDEDVIIHLDGDDWFADEHSLHKLAEAYLDDTLVTYGGAVRLQNKEFTEPFMHALSDKQIEKKWGKKVGPKYPSEVILNREYRNYPWGACHCRTFKYNLYKQIYRSDFIDSEGEYFKYATDMAVFIPILEMAGSKVKYIEDTIYIYNRDTGDNNVASQFTGKHINHNLMRSKAKYPIFIGN